MNKESKNYHVRKKEKILFFKKKILIVETV